jgi:fluoride exporter
VDFGYQGVVTWLFIALGGAAGTLLRYALARFTLGDPAWHGFPWATLAANVIGSTLLGFLFVWGDGRSFFGSDVRLALGTGVMGGFTTYSTFNLETLRLVEDGEAGRALAYVTLTLVLCAVGGLAGLSLARALR